MKRPGDEFYVRSQVKRPFASSRNESYIQSQVAGGEGTSQRLTTNDALSYLKDVKDKFQDQREKYDQFLEVMKDFKTQRANTAGVIQRVKDLFKGHNNLILGFNTFLPKGYEITLEEKKTVEFEEAIGFVNKIKKRFQHDEHVYKSFLDILNMYRKEHKGITAVYHEVAILFDDHPDLLDEFTRFLPDNSAAPSMLQAPYNRSSLPCYEERSSAVPSLKKYPVDKLHRRDRMLHSRAERGLSVDRPDLEVDKASVKLLKEQRKQAEKNAHEKRYRDHDDRELGHDRKISRKSEGFAYPSATVEDYSAIKNMYSREFGFCDEVKERVTDPDEYQTFLKCLNIYSTEIVSKTELQNLMADLLGKYPDLVEGFSEFLERCENTDGFLAGVMNEYSKSMKVDEREKILKRKTDTSNDTDRHKEKYMAKSIRELDLSNCQRCTPSYRLLPEDHPIQRASQRSELGAQVLNDNWVSVTSGSEDYSFKHMRRNQYEESLFRCEDDRFELDMLLESVSSASGRVEELLNKLNDDALDVVIPLHLEEHFSALNLRCMEQLYGDHGLDAVDIIRRNPFMALPVILTRLKQKKEEWLRCRADFNKVWADIYAKNHYKSLDHRSFYFKQQNSKNLSTKSLVAEIKEVKETKQECDVLLTIAAGTRRPIIPNLEFQYPDPDIHGNLYDLVLYSCEETCSTKEQASKVLRLWTTFLEPMLGIPARIGNGDSVDAIETNGHQDMNVESCIGSSEKAIGGVTDRPTVRTTSTSKPSTSAGNENSLQETLVAHGETLAKENGKAGFDTISKDGAYTSTIQSVSALENCIPNMPGSALQDASDQLSTNSAAPLPTATEISQNKMCIDVAPASSRDMNDGSKNGANQKPSIDGSLLEDGSLDKLKNGETADVSNRYAYQGAIGESSKIEKEEGELSPTVDSEGDAPPSPIEDRDVKSPHHDIGEAICSQDPVEENDADDEDSENISIAGEVSGSESAGEDCSNEEHDEEDEVEHEEIDGKVESEGEAEGLHDANSVGGDAALPHLSDRFLLAVKPLAKYVSSEWCDEANNETRVFYGNDNYYVLLRLHQMLYERILFAKSNTVAAEVRQKPLTDHSSLEPFKRFLKALYSLLDGSADNSKFEDDCRTLIGNHSYVLFTLDKLIYKLVKQLQSVASDETDLKLRQLYDYEKSRNCKDGADSIYHENARILLHEENIYRFECKSSPPSLFMQLMGSEGEKPEVPAVSIDPNFGDYLYNDFLAVIPSQREPSDVFMQRNKSLLYDRLYESPAAGKQSIDSVKMVNGLEYKIVCNTSKISYVLDTEDYLFRSKRKRKNVSAEKSSLINQTRLERLNKLLHVFNSN